MSPSGGVQSKLVQLKHISQTGVWDGEQLGDFCDFSAKPIKSNLDHISHDCIAISNKYIAKIGKSFQRIDCPDPSVLSYLQVKSEPCLNA